MKTELIIVCGSVLGIATNCAAEYAPPRSLTQPSQVIRIGSPPYATEESDDTAVFQRAIDVVHEGGGGHVIVPAGEYHLNRVALKSEVHIIFEKGVKLHLSPDGRGKMNGWLFSLGRDGQYAENVSLTARSTWVDVYMPRDTQSVRLVVAADVNNFHISGFMIHDRRTVHSSLIFVWDGEEDGRSKLPKDGLIENIWAKNAHYGYGALQVHAGNCLHFRNILAVGGVAARLETGLTNMNLAAWGRKPGYIGLDDISLEDITSIYGQAALMTEPHTIRHGSVVARDIKADGSEFGVSICDGFVSRGKYFDSGQTVVDPNELSAGNFRSIRIDGVQANYRDDDIITRYPHYKYYPVELHDRIKKVESAYGEPGSRGPSIAAVYNGQANDPETTIANLQTRGYKYHPDIITKQDLFAGSLKEISTQPAIQDAPDLPWAGVDVAFLAPTIRKKVAQVGEPYRGDLARDVSYLGKADRRPVFTIIFGPDWLTVAADGSLGGTPSAAGEYFFTVKADMGAKGFDIAQLTILVEP